MNVLTNAVYIDCFSGLSGDMFLGALIDAGWPTGRLQEVINSLDLPGVTAEIKQVTKQSIGATQVKIIVPSGQPHRHYANLKDIIERADFAPDLKQQALNTLRMLGEAESAVHRIPLEQVHFHEIGAVDTLIDIVGTIIGLHDLGVTVVHSAPLPWSHGSIKIAHGILPVPPPAVAALLQGIPVVGVDMEGEMVTPTGAALVRSLSSSFGTIPTMHVDKVGYGAGQRDWPDRPNVLRLVIGTVQTDTRHLVETLTVLACNLDDMNPQWYGPLMQTLLDAHALDVWITPAHMKKNRPASVIEVLCQPQHADRLRGLMLRHTTTLGIRQHTVSRYSLQRRIETIDTEYGPVRVKVATLPDGSEKAAPEHDDCVARATDHVIKGISPREVWLAAVRAYDRGE